MPLQARIPARTRVTGEVSIDKVRPTSSRVSADPAGSNRLPSCGWSRSNGCRCLENRQDSRQTGTVSERATLSGPALDSKDGIVSCPSDASCNRRYGKLEHRLAFARRAAMSMTPCERQGSTYLRNSYPASSQMASWLQTMLPAIRRSYRRRSFVLKDQHPKRSDKQCRKLGDLLDQSYELRVNLTENVDTG